MSFPRYQLSGDAKAPGGSALQEAVSSKLDSLFAEYLSLYAEVRSERASASACLKDGFFALSQARHAMPAGAAGVALDSSAYSGRDIQPTIGWSCASLHAAADDDSQTKKDLKQIESPAVFTVTPIEYKDAEDEDEDFEGDNDAEEKGDGVRKRVGKSVSSAAAATTAASVASTSDDSSAAPAAPTPAALDLRSLPLQWFGVLAPVVQLGAVSSAFLSSLTPLARIASLSHRLQEVENKFKYLSHLQQASHVDPHAEDELAQILEKIKISDEKKATAAAAATKKDASSEAATPVAAAEASISADKQ